jgi:hypothetical protein
VTPLTTTGLCAWCGDPLVGFERTTRKYCDDACRGAARTDRKKAALRVKPPKTCGCNGSHIPAHNEDGLAICAKCGALIEGHRVSSLGGLDFFSALMEVPLYRAPSVKERAWSPPSRRRISTDVRVYTGEPFRPESEVEIRPASSFRSTRKGRGR